jgi:pimeloyl-ACP methyl ester carboxylesterase
MAVSESLGSSHDIAVGGARIRYRERGQGPAIVFVHGLMVNGDLWRNVVPTIADAGYRCIVPDWPLGSHEVAVPDADLTPPGVAALIAGFLDALDLTDVMIVANDTGGALTQLVMTQHPERLSRVVLTPSDCFEQFFPPLFAGLPKLARIPGAIWLLAQTMRLRVMRQSPIAYGWLAKREMPAEIMASYVGPILHNRAIRRDGARFLRGVHKRHALAAAERLPTFTKPVLLAWASEDRVFKPRLADRLLEVLPNATKVLIEDAWTFVPEDQPAELARRILEFARVDAAA